MATVKRDIRSITTDTKIKTAQDMMAWQKARLDKPIAKLEALMAKRKELRKRELIASDPTRRYFSLSGDDDCRLEIDARF